MQAVSSAGRTAPRLIQHKAEAFWFYRFLSIVYDHIVNPGQLMPKAAHGALATCGALHAEAVS